MRTNRSFSERGGFLESRQSNKHFIFDKRKKDFADENILHVLKLFLFLEEFEPQCFYKIVLLKKS